MAQKLEYYKHVGCRTYNVGMQVGGVLVLGGVVYIVVSVPASQCGLMGGRSHCNSVQIT